jgi:hypothetical protein
MGTVDRRARQLNQLKKLIDAGAYRIDPLAVADAILQRAEMEALTPAPRPRRSGAPATGRHAA